MNIPLGYINALNYKELDPPLALYYLYPELSADRVKKDIIARVVVRLGILLGLSFFDHKHLNRAAGFDEFQSEPVLNGLQREFRLSGLIR